MDMHSLPVILRAWSICRSKIKMREEKDTPAALSCSNAFYIKFVDIIPYNTHGKPTYEYKEGDA